MRRETESMWRAGLFAGLLGYGVVVVFFAALNVLAGRSPFYTAAMLGAALFFDLRDPADLVVSPAPVLTYNMVHVLVFVGLGLLTSWLITLAERYPVTRFLVLFTLLFVAAHVYAALLLFAGPFLAGASWQIGVSSLAAAIMMAAYLLVQHPGLRRNLTALPMGEE